MHGSNGFLLDYVLVQAGTSPSYYMNTTDFQPPKPSNFSQMYRLSTPQCDLPPPLVDRLDVT